MANHISDAENATKTFVHDAVAGSAPHSEKQPLYRTLPPALPFPTRSLGPLYEAACAIQQITGAPIEIAAQSVLAAAFLAIQSHRNVLLPGGGEKPLTALFCSIAASGERKSAVDKLALQAIHAFETEEAKRLQKDLSKYRNKLEAWESTRRKIKNDKKLELGAMEAALSELGPEPRRPIGSMLLIADLTPEGLVMHLQHERPSVGIFTSEGGLLLGGHGFSDDAAMRTASLLNILWDGDTVRRKRVGTGTSQLPGRRCSAHIMMQPVVASQLFGQTLFEDIGLTARMLTVAPATTAGTRAFSKPPKEAFDALSRFQLRIHGLLKRPAVADSEDPFILKPRQMKLSPKAEKLWIDFYNVSETAIGPKGALNSIRAFASKLPEHAGRIAAVLTTYNDFDTNEVHADAMQSGIDLATHYANEMMRLQAHANVPTQLLMAQLLLEWWKEIGQPKLYLAKIYQYGPRKLRNKAAALKAIDALEKHGWCRKVPNGAILDNKHRRDVWELVP